MPKIGGRFMITHDEEHELIKLIRDKTLTEEEKLDRIKILSASCDVIDIVNIGQSALIIASTERYVKIVNALLDYGAKCELREVANEIGKFAFISPHAELLTIWIRYSLCFYKDQLLGEYSVLQKSFKIGIVKNITSINPDIFRILLDAEKKIVSPEDYQNTLQEIMIELIISFSADPPSKESLDMLSFLLEQGAMIHRPKKGESNLYTPFMQAARLGSSEVLSLFLNRKEAETSAENMDDALWLAVEFGCADSVRKLLAAGGNPNIRRKGGLTLRECALIRSDDVIESVLQKALLQKEIAKRREAHKQLEPEEVEKLQGVITAHMKEEDLRRSHAVQASVGQPVVQVLRESCNVAINGLARPALNQDGSRSVMNFFGASWRLPDRCDSSDKSGREFAIKESENLEKNPLPKKSEIDNTPLENTPRPPRKPGF
jgi:ankyrin repeat protein